MGNSATKRNQRKHRLEDFMLQLPSLRAEWYRIEQLTKYQFTMEYSAEQGQTVQVYPTTLRIVTSEHQSIGCTSISDLLEKAEHYSLARGNYYAQV